MTLQIVRMTAHLAWQCLFEPEIFKMLSGFYVFVSSLFL
jgi:hypothetical protein